MEKVGIANLKACIKEVKTLVEVADLVMADGKVGVTDVVHLPALYSATAKLVSAAQMSQPEIKDIDVSEAQELLSDVLALVALVAKKFGFQV